MHRKLLKVFMDEAVQIIKAYFEKKHKATPGIIAGLHTYVVHQMDMTDDGDPTVLPQFRYEQCDGAMYPEYYK